MATPNYGYEKRQRELAKKKKKEEKLREKSYRKSDGSSDGSVAPDSDTPQESNSGADAGPAAAG